MRARVLSSGMAIERRSSILSACPPARNDGKPSPVLADHRPVPRGRASAAWRADAKRWICGVRVAWRDPLRLPPPAIPQSDQRARLRDRPTACIPVEHHWSYSSGLVEGRQAALGAQRPAFPLRPEPGAPPSWSIERPVRHQPGLPLDSVPCSVSRSATWEILHSYSGLVRGRVHCQFVLQRQSPIRLRIKARRTMRSWLQLLALVGGGSVVPLRVVHRCSPQPPRSLVPLDRPPSR